MLSHYLEIMWLLVGIYIVCRTVPILSPWINYVVGAFMIVLSVIKIFGA